MPFDFHPDVQDVVQSNLYRQDVADWDAELAAIRRDYQQSFKPPTSPEQLLAKEQQQQAINREANDFYRSVARDRNARQLEQNVFNRPVGLDERRARQAAAQQEATRFRSELARNQTATWEEWNAPSPGTPARSPRVSRPSTGGLPPTPRTGGQPFRPPYDPTNIHTGAPRQPIGLPQSIGQRPSSLPQPVPRGPSPAAALSPVAGVGVGAAAGAATSAALGIAMGAPPGPTIAAAAGSVVGSVGGAVVGGAVGSFFGPVGTVVGANVGGVVGGFIGGGLAGALSNVLMPPTTDRPLALPEQGRETPPFTGGQTPGIIYKVQYEFSFAGTGTFQGEAQVFGPIGSVRLVPDLDGFTTFLLDAVDATYRTPKTNLAAIGRPNDPAPYIKIHGVQRLDGQPDTGGNMPTPLVPPVLNPQGRSQLVVNLPPSGAPAGTPNAQGAPVARPSGLPQGGTQRGDSPDWIPSGSLAPKQMPSPDIVPRPPISPIPDTVAPPAKNPGNPKTNPDDAAQKGKQNSGLSIGAIATGLTPLAIAPATRVRPTPTRNRVYYPGNEPISEPPTAPSQSPCRGNGCGGANLRQSQQNADLIRAMQAQIFGLQSQLTLAGIGADAVGNAAIMAKLNALDAKLGPQIPNGGIANFIKKTWDFLQVDRILSVLTFIGVLHNAYFLSNSLAQTLFSAIGNSLAVFGVTNAEGQPLEVGSIVSKYTDSFFKSIFGVEEVEGFKAAWKKYNRIYQAASNVVSSVQSLVYSVQSILEVIGQNVSKIGNALKAWGAVSDRAYGWMSENSSKTGILGAFDRVRDKTQAIEEITSNIDGVASEVLGARETLAEFEKQTEELRKLQAEGVPKPQIENIPIKQLQEAQKAVSVSPPITSSDLVKPEV